MSFLSIHFIEWHAPRNGAVQHPFRIAPSGSFAFSQSRPTQSRDRKSRSTYQNMSAIDAKSSSAAPT
jgi:hypothetical protein